MVRPWKRHRGTRTERLGAPRSGAPRSDAPKPDAPRSSVPQDDNPTGPRSSNPLADPSFRAGLRPVPTGRLAEPRPWPAESLVGSDPDGEPLELEFDRGRRTLLGFLATDCDGCEEFWSCFRHEGSSLPGGATCILVVKPRPIATSDLLPDLAAGVRWPVLVSDEAWPTFGVTGYPVFLVLDGATKTVTGETIGFQWSDVLELLRPS